MLAAKVAGSAPNRVDRELAAVLGATKSSVAFRVADVVSLGGSPVFVVLAACALALTTWTYRRDLRLAAACILAPAIGGLAQLAVKDAVGPRMPVSIDPWSPARRLAFPSGHATGAATIATLVVILVLTSSLARTQRSAVVAGVAVYAVVVAASRIVIDDHLAMDAVGGLLLGTAVSALTASAALHRSSARATGDRTASSVTP